MTMKPKAQKFRVRRSPHTAETPTSIADTIEDAVAETITPQSEDAQEQAAQPKTVEHNVSLPAAAHDDARLFESSADSDGFGDVPFPGAAAAEAPLKRTARPLSHEAMSPNPQGTQNTGDLPPNPQPSAAHTHPQTDANTDTNIDEEIAAIRKEGLTGRQLRTARRLAQQNNLHPVSDFDAVRQLRNKNIDPFERSSSMVNMIKESDKKLPAARKPELPEPIQTAPAPPPNVMERIARETDISQIQRDIAKRRRKKTLRLISRVAVFVGIPTLLCGIYFYTYATPMYATQSAFIIQNADSAAATGGLFSGTSFGSSPDAIAVQDYLESRDAMLRLDADASFKAHFASSAIDTIQRLPEEPSNEQAYKVYSDRVKIGYDPTEGLIKMEVIAADPLISQQFSEALIDYAEERVDQLTQRLRIDQVEGAQSSLDDAETRMRAAQENVIELQEQLGIISPEAETSALMSQISTFEVQLQQKQLQLQQLLDNTRPNQARVEGTQGDIRRLENLVADLRAQMTENQGNSGSLARISAELRMAEVDLETRLMMTQQAVQTLETSRTEVNRQTRYLSLSSSPVAPDEPTYPRKFENTMLSFLLFSGIYLLASLTAAVLREQISA